MPSYINLSKLILTAILLIPCYAAAEESSITKRDVMHQRLQKEKIGHNNSFLISLYRPTYILPFSHTSKPFKEIYSGNTPQAQAIERNETKFQISFKLPVWQHFLNNPQSTLYIAYTQQSYWQTYNHSAFFRESNYEPETFITYHLNQRLFDHWKLSFLNLGFSHQSNGKGGNLERSWNRVYGEAIFANSNWMLSIKPWFVVRDNSYKRYNENLARYLGYERIAASYKHKQHVFTIETRNTLESRFKRGAVQASWSFPLTPHLRAYTELFSGYGQSLIEYDHYTHSIGIGIALNDWI